ncbi:uncharacterized protein LOC126839966 [Adelges cooleyi]|uniref:uncharacterized protein LOC126839966 n=1 Tax=Adelges cooleyi TaxID=133065 RepID=UPI00217F44A4|nr:uncharacterized protein LOC126839966 [Adelges cooleyi]
MTEELAHNRSVVGKSFEYYENIFKSGKIEDEIARMKYGHLKFAIDQKLISDKELYNNNTSNNQLLYRPHTLQDFVKLLKQHEPLGNEASAKVAEQLKKLQLQVQNNIEVKTNEENSNQTNSSNPVRFDEFKNNSETSVKTNLTTSKKRRRKKKKTNGHNQTSLEAENTNNCENYINDGQNVKSQEDVPKKKVQIFIRRPAKI